MRTSTNYRFTLPVVNGVIQDPEHTLDRLRAICAFENRGWQCQVGRRWVVDLKYRGPRCGQHYNTPRDAAYAVDVYRRLRQEWV